MVRGSEGMRETDEGERETKTERRSTATLSHRDTWRHKEREMDIQVDAVIRTQTDTGRDKHLETERLSKSAGDTQHRRGKADSSLGTARCSLFLCSSGASNPSVEPCPGLRGEALISEPLGSTDRV